MPSLVLSLLAVGEVFAYVPCMSVRCRDKRIRLHKRSNDSGQKLPEDQQVNAQVTKYCCCTSNKAFCTPVLHTTSNAWFEPNQASWAATAEIPRCVLLLHIALHTFFY